MRKNNIRKISMLLVLVMIVSLFSWDIASAESKLPNVSAHAYVVMDANSGEILFSKNKTKSIYPASTVKLMTAVVALENASVTKKITTKKSVLLDIPKDASGIGLKANKTYSLQNLLEMMLIVSAADAAATIAGGISETTKKFVGRMNDKASELGLENTSFDNVVGLDVGNGYKKTYTTASDFAILARYSMSKVTIRDIVAMKTFKVPKSINKKAVILKSTNLFYSTADYSKDRYTIIGTKTGTTKAAGSVLIATARDSQNHEVICAFFGNVNRSNTYQDVKELFDYTFDEYNKGNIALSKGFYDVRYRESESTILKYCNEDLLTGKEDGSFLPMAKVKQKEFVDTINKIANSQLLADSKDKYTTVLAFADILMKAYPVDVSEENIAVLKEVFSSTEPLSDDNLKNLTALYNANILPVDYEYNVDSNITKEDMVLIADKLQTYTPNTSLPQ